MRLAVTDPLKFPPVCNPPGYAFCYGMNQAMQPLEAEAVNRVNATRSTRSRTGLVLPTMWQCYHRHAQKIARSKPRARSSHMESSTLRAGEAIHQARREERCGDIGRAAQSPT